MVQVGFIQAVQTKNGHIDNASPVALQIMTDGVNTYLSKVSISSSQFEGSSTVGYYYKLTGTAPFDGVTVDTVKAALTKIGKGHYALVDSRSKNGLNSKKVYVDGGVLYMEYHGTVTNKATGKETVTDSFWHCDIAKLIPALDKLEQCLTVDKLLSLSQQYIGKRGTVQSTLGDQLKALLAAK